MSTEYVNVIGAGIEESQTGSPHPLDEDKWLLARALDNDGTAFARLVQPHMRKAYRIAFRITRNREDAEDATQQSLLNAYMHLANFHGQSLFSTWFLRITINEALGKVRKQRSTLAYLSYDVDDTGKSGSLAWRAGDDSRPEVLYAKAENRRLLWEAIESLQAGSRAIVCLLGLEERQTKETALILNLSEPAVKARFARARHKLRQSLGDRI